MVFYTIKHFHFWNEHEGINSPSIFYPREQELKAFQALLSKKSPVMLVAARNHGRLELLHSITVELKSPHITLNGLFAAEPKAFENLVLKKLGKLLIQLMPKTVKQKQKVLDCFRKFRPELAMSEVGQTVKLHTYALKDEECAAVIFEAFLSLDKAAHFQKNGLL